MNAQIGVRLKEILNGWMNIDFATQSNENDRIFAEPMKIDAILDANECEILNVTDSADFMPIQARSQLLNHWCSFISHGGQLIMMGLDPYEFSRQVHNGQLSLQQANELAYGIGKKSFCDIPNNIAIVTANGQMEVEKIVPGLFYTIMFRRK